MDHRFCTACGSPLPVAAAFCPACGQRVEPAATPGAGDADTGYLPLVEPAAAPLPEPRRESRAASAADDVPPPRVAEPVAAPERGGNWPLWLALVLIAGALGFGAWWTLLRDTEQQARFADDTATGGATAAPVAGPAPGATTEVFLSDTVTLRTAGMANVRNAPSAADTVVVSALPPNAEVVGRWVRGRDGQSRWLRLDSGGYVWDGNIGVPEPLGPPIRLNIGNQGCDWGRDFAALIPPPMNADHNDDIQEGDSVYKAVTPARPWRGLTVTAVALHYESVSVVFQDAPERVAAVLRDAGVRVGRDGSVPVPDTEGASQMLTATKGEGARYGRTELDCGIS
jgi:hypothetical protein